MVVIEERDEEKRGSKEESIREINKFIEDFNEEAKKQNSRWVARMKYGCPHIIKKRLYLEVAGFQILYSDGEFDFVDNDYMIGEATREANLEFFKYYEEFKPILEKIPQKFRIE